LARATLAAMFEYSSVRASSYDLEGLIASLNAKDAEGWEVVSVVPAGGELAAILRRSSSTSLSTSSSYSSAPTSSYGGLGKSSAPAETNSVEAAPAVEAAPEPTPEEPEPVREPAGWGAVADPSPAPSSAASSWGNNAGTSVSPDPSPAAASAPTAVQPSVPTTPAGWYPDPSGRFEMRYWDGGAWTEHVARGGQQFTDPPVA
jgi:hypothetical protein